MTNEYNYSGHESAFVPTPPENTNSTNVDRKTDKKSNNKDKKEADRVQQFTSLNKKNKLASYRSYTYNFVLAALYKDQVNDPARFRNSELDLIILKSGGKGGEGIRQASAVEERLRITKAANKEEKKKAQEELGKRAPTLRAIDGFNKESPGRFDMFIDDVEIETTMAFSQQGGTTQPTSIRFEVIEPYSINGFLEAIQVAAVRAGYPNYASASFLLKVQFVGYKDDVDIPDPEFIDKTERYFAIGFTSVEIEVTERGTKYRCSCVIYNEKSFGQPGKLKKSVKMSGENVREILEDLMLNINDQELQNAKKNGSKNFDQYAIKFIKPAGNGWVDDRGGVIAESKIVELGSDSNLFQMIDPAQTQKKSNYKVIKDVPPSKDTEKDEVKFEPKKSVVQFPENVSLHEIIAAVIRDSEYVANLIKDFKVDDVGMVDYFIVRTEVKNQDVIDPKAKRPYQIFTYVVTPYKVHYTNIPHLESSNVSEKNLKKGVLREYNYLYTGQNTEVRNFRLQFNNLYFEAIPQDGGNKDKPSSKNAARNANSPSVKAKNPTLNSETTVPQPAKRTDPTATAILPPSGYTAGLPKNDPYSVLARTMHEKMLNSLSLATCELEIVGDPFFLVTGGTGNYNPGLITNLETVDGEAAHIIGQVLIAINFRNPIDINPSTGMMIFDKNRIPFSGVFQVNKVKSTFKDGFFNQRMDLVRIPGQLIDQGNLQPDDPEDIIFTEDNPKDRVIPEETQAQDYGKRLEADLAVVERGLPSPDTNFTGAVGGLGGDQQVQSFGNYPLEGSLQAGSSPIGKPLPNDVSRSIRLSQLGIAELSQTSLENSSKIKQTIGSLLSYTDKDKVKSLADNVLGSQLKNNNVLNQGSGIGEGAKILLSQSETFTGDVSYNNAYSKTLSNLNVESITGLNDYQSANILNNAGSFIKSRLGSKADPMAIASNIGLDASKVSGLGSLFQSKVSKNILSYSDTPDDLNLTQSVKEGTLLEFMNSSDLENLPKSQPRTTAPQPSTNKEYMDKVVAGGGIRALANLYGASSVDRISGSMVSKMDLSSAMKNVGAANFNPYKNNTVFSNSSDIESYSGRIQSARSQLTPLTGDTFIRDQSLSGTVSSVFGSRGAGKSPLDKLVNNIENSNNPPYTGDNPIIRKNLGMPPLET